MNTSSAFVLAGIIGFHYSNKLTDSIAINEEIAINLGSNLYKRFCEEIAFMKNKKKYFSIDVLKNPVDEKDYLTDFEVRENYSLDSLMNVLAEITKD